MSLSAALLCSLLAGPSAAQHRDPVEVAGTQATTGQCSVGRFAGWNHVYVYYATADGRSAASGQDIMQARVCQYGQRLCQPGFTGGINTKRSRGRSGGHHLVLDQ